MDFSKLDAEAAQLDLIVVAAEELQQSVIAPARQVTGAVHALAGLLGERVGDEAFGGQVGAVQIALRQLHTGDVHFAGHADRNRLTVAIEHIRTAARQRPAERDPCRVCGYCRDRMDHAEGGGFGRAITMQQPLWRGLGQDRGDGTGIDAVAAGEQATQRRQECAHSLPVAGQQPGGQMQDADLAGGQVPRQCVRVEQGLLIDDDDGRAMQQRGPYLECTGIEGGIGEEGDAVLRLQRRMLLAECEGQHSRMRHRHTLGRAGGARGVHDVGRGRGRGRHGDRRWRGCVRVVEIGQAEAGHACRSEHAVGFLDQHLGLCIGDQREQALARMRAIQRHIDRRALEHGQLRDDQLDRARQRNGYLRACAQAQREQTLRQPVGACVECGITDALLVGDHGDGIGRALRLGFEQPVHGLRRHGDGRPRAEHGQQVLALRRIQQRQPGHRHVVVRGHGPQQMDEAGEEALHGAALEQRRGIAERADDGSVALVQRQLQIELADRRWTLHAVQVQIVQLQRDAGGVLPGEHDLEQRMVGQVARRVERFDHLLEGHVLMRLCGQRGSAHLAQQFGERGLAPQVDAQRLGVDEQADQRLQFAAGAVGDRHPDDHLLLAGQARQQHAPGGQQGHEQSAPVALAQRCQRSAELGIERALDGVAAGVRSRRARAVGG